MFTARITGLYQRLTQAKVKVNAIAVDEQEAVPSDEQGGDIYIHFHIGWKAFAVFGMVVGQTVLTLIKERNLFF